MVSFYVKSFLFISKKKKYKLTLHRKISSAGAERFDVDVDACHTYLCESTFKKFLGIQILKGSHNRLTRSFENARFFIYHFPSWAWIIAGTSPDLRNGHVSTVMYTWHLQMSACWRAYKLYIYSPVKKIQFKIEKIEIAF